MSAPGPVRIVGMDSSSTTRRQATRQKLYEAAVTLIAEKGFSATTVDEIAERAGVAKGTVYYNFASKSVLFEELLRHGVGLLAASLREALSGYVGHARKVTGGGRRTRRSSGGSSSSSSNTKDVREWAKAQGMEVSERGRISADVQQAYDAAH